jgi:hypothetical protein
MHLQYPHNIFLWEHSHNQEQYTNETVKETHIEYEEVEVEAATAT